MRYLLFIILLAGVVFAAGCVSEKNIIITPTKTLTPITTISTSSPVPTKPPTPAPTKTPTTIPTTRKYDPEITQKVVQVGTPTIEVSYPKSSTPTVVSGKYRWSYVITFTDVSGNGFALTNRTRYYTSADGSRYTRWGLSVSKELFNYDITPHGSYSDDTWVQCNITECTFCGGRAHYVYFGQSKNGKSFEIPVEIYLKYP